MTLSWKFHITDVYWGDSKHQMENKRRVVDVIIEDYINLWLWTQISGKYYLDDETRKNPAFYIGIYLGSFLERQLYFLISDFLDELNHGNTGTK